MALSGAESLEVGRLQMRFKCEHKKFIVAQADKETYFRHDSLVFLCNLVNVPKNFLSFVLSESKTADSFNNE